MGKLNEGITPADILSVEAIASFLGISCNNINYRWDEVEEHWTATYHDELGNVVVFARNYPHGWVEEI